MATDPSRQSSLTGLAEHPLRRALTDEVHTRPPERLSAPLQVSHLAMLSGEDAGDRDHEHLRALCERLRAPQPGPGATHHSVDLGACRLKWERHTEFSTYTVFRTGAADGWPAEPALRSLPADWVAGMAGTLLVGIHLAVLPRGVPEPGPADLAAAFGADPPVGSRVAGGAATAWADFRLKDDGFSRFLVHDCGLSPGQTGRLVQRLVEIETYRMMALLALPLARAALPRIGTIEQQLLDLTTRTSAIGGLDDERTMLDALTRLAAESERIAAETSYRFGAARAYYGLVERRIGELRETRIEGLQTIAEFMERRMAPAVRTCEAVAARLDGLSARVARASNLLRTRIDIALEGQNRDLLESMDRRAQIQLRLQETVEGLSVVAITYYLIGLVAYAAKGLKAAQAGIDPDLVVGLAIPVALALVWAGVRQVRRRTAGRPD